MKTSFAVFVFAVPLLTGVSGCATGAERANSYAFQSCKALSGTTDFKRCTSDKQDEYAAAQAKRAAEFQKVQAACDDKRAKASAMGGDSAKLACHGDSPLQYALDGVN